jgi:1-acyl-sn-glycerol-3-phosphate acyltransferase
MQFLVGWRIASGLQYAKGARSGDVMGLTTTPTANIGRLGSHNTATEAPNSVTPPAAPQRTTVSLLLLPLQLIYGIYAATTFLALALLSLLPLAVIPTLAGRRRLIQWVGRASLTLMAMPVRIRWPAGLPDPCIVVANHCSYLDGVVLAAVLPPRFGFVIKREMASVPLAGFLLRRIGVQFVTRGNRSGGSRDALRVIRSAARGESLAFFPEGTFLREPGLLRFHTGAFTAAERSGTAVVPLAILGTRHCLTPGQILPRPGQISVTALGVLRPDSGQPEGAAALRDAARAAILAATGDIDAAGRDA